MCHHLSISENNDGFLIVPYFVSCNVFRTLQMVMLCREEMSQLGYHVILQDAQVA
jgi:hypothetical protein